MRVPPRPPRGFFAVGIIGSGGGTGKAPPPRGLKFHNFWSTFGDWPPPTRRYGVSANTIFSVDLSGIGPAFRCYAGVCRHAVVAVVEVPSTNCHCALFAAEGYHRPSK